MRIWKRDISTEVLTQLSANTASGHLGIEYLEVGDDFIVARLPVNGKTRQPYGLLHGGVSVLFAETLGSRGAAFASPPGARAVGLEINANHLKGATQGWVTGKAHPLHIGRSTHVWSIELRNEDEELTCVSRITVSILSPPNPT